MNKKYFFFILFLVPQFLIAGNDNFATGGRQAGMGNAGATLTDLWSVQQNQAGLANLKSISVGFAYESRFLVDGLSQKSGAVAVPVKNLGVFGAMISDYGFTLYKEQKIGIAYSKTFGKTISFGVQMDYLSTAIGEDYGHRSTLAAEAGIIARITNGLDIGAHIYNPSRAKLSDYNDERSPVIMKVGFGYHFSEKVLLCAESEKDVDAKNSFKAGLEYNVTKPFFLRAGISSNPSVFSFGFGLRMKNFILNAASSMHPVLGYSPQFSLSYEFK